MTAGFSQMPTLGEFVARARIYGYTRHIILIREIRAKIVYLRRGRDDALKVVDLPPIRETERLTRATLESLCRRAGIPEEDFGLPS